MHGRCDSERSLLDYGVCSNLFARNQRGAIGPPKFPQTYLLGAATSCNIFSPLKYQLVAALIHDMLFAIQQFLCDLQIWLEQISSAQRQRRGCNNITLFQRTASIACSLCEGCTRHDLHILVTAPFCCDRKARAACARRFALWQQATMEITRRDHSIIACSRHLYIGVVRRAHSVAHTSHNRHLTTILVMHHRSKKKLFVCACANLSIRRLEKSRIIHYDSSRIIW